MSQETPKIDDLLTGETIEKATDSVAGLLEKEIFQSQSLIEVGIIIAGIFVSIYLSRKIRALILDWESSFQSRSRRFLFAALRRLVFPSLLFAWVGLFAILYIVIKQPWPILSTAMSLTLAWFVIRLGTSFIDNPLISKTVSAVVWVIAALNILGYLSSVVEFLDKTKINAGQSSISLYAIVSSIFSIAIFLWIAFALIKTSRQYSKEQ